MGFNLSNWSKAIDDSEHTQKPNIKTNKQAFNASIGGDSFHSVKSPQYNTLLGSRHRKIGRPYLVTAVDALVSRTREKEHMLSPNTSNTDAATSLNVAATSTHSNITHKAPPEVLNQKSKNTKLPSSNTAKKGKKKKNKPVKRLSTASSIKRLQQARIRQLTSSHTASVKSKKAKNTKKAAVKK